MIPLRSRKLSFRLQTKIKTVFWPKENWTKPFRNSRRQIKCQAPESGWGKDSEMLTKLMVAAETTRWHLVTHSENLERFLDMTIQITAASSTLSFQKARYKRSRTSNMVQRLINILIVSKTYSLMPTCPLNGTNELKDLSSCSCMEATLNLATKKVKVPGLDMSWQCVAMLLSQSSIVWSIIMMTIKQYMTRNKIWGQPSAFWEKTHNSTVLTPIG